MHLFWEIKKGLIFTLLKCFYFLAFTFNTYYLYIFKLIIMNLSKYADLSWLSFEELVLIHYLFVCLQIDSTSILFCLFADPHFDWPFWECSFGFFRRICLFFSVPSSTRTLIRYYFSTSIPLWTCSRWPKGKKELAWNSSMKAFNKVSV